MIQKKIAEGELQHINLYVESIQDSKLQRQTLTIQDDQLNILKLFQNVSSSAQTEYKFNTLKPSKNIKNCIVELIADFPHEDEKTVELLLNDFKHCLRTQQRMSNRYVLLAIFKDNLELIHSRKEAGIGKLDSNKDSPLQVIKRYFDAGNVDRWVRVFKKDNSELKVRLYERNKSPVLYNFLGVPRGKRFYEFGDVRLLVQYMDTELSIDLSIEEAIKKIIDSNDITFKGNFVLIGETRFQLSKILSGKDEIKTPSKLRQLLQSEKYSLSKVIAEYKKLPNRIDYYGKYLNEDSHAVFSTEAGDSLVEDILFEKPDNPVEIICTNNCVWPTEEYLNSITEKICQNNGLIIYHPGHKLADVALDYGNIKILNECNLPDNINNIVTQLLNHANQYDMGHVLKHIFISHAFGILANSIDEPLKTFLASISSGVCGHCYIDKKEMITKNENSFIEYKSGKKLTGNVETDIDLINEDVYKKASNSSTRLILYGVDEETMTIDKVHKNILISDSIGLIENTIRENTGMLVKCSSLTISDTHKILAISVSNKDYVEEFNPELFNILSP